MNKSSEVCKCEACLGSQASGNVWGGRGEAQEVGSGPVLGLVTTQAKGFERIQLAQRAQLSLVLAIPRVLSKSRDNTSEREAPRDDLHSFIHRYA